jgi:hypothetical protein
MRIKLSILVSFCTLLLFILNSCQGRADPQQGVTDLLPAPQKMEFNKGVSLNPQKIKTIYLYAQAGKDDRFAARLLQGKIDTLFSPNIDVQLVDSYKSISRPAVVLGISSADQEFKKFYSSLSLPSPKKNAQQAYVLNIGKNLITISGGGQAGLFYGIQTLNQLLEDAKWSSKPLQGTLIQDWPDIKWRAAHFDVKHHLDRYEYLKDAIAKLARYKVNVVVFEFADKFNYKSHPVIAAPHSFSPEQVKALTKYAHKYHINIIPLVQGLGHAPYILAHAKFKDLRADPQSPWAFNPLKKGTYDLLFDLYHEAMQATPGVDYFDVGGDEVWFTGNNPKLQAYKEKHGPFSLYLLWLNKVNDYVNSQGRTVILWDDVPLKIAGLWRLTRKKDIPESIFDSLWTAGANKLDQVIDKFPKNAIYTQWSYFTQWVNGAGSDREGNARLINWFNKHDIKEISATAIQNTRPLIPSYKKKPANIKSFVTLSARKNVWGEFCTAWDDSGVHFETFWMGFLASAEYAWHGKDHPVTLRQYWKKYIYRFFGPNTDRLYKAFHNLSKRVTFWNHAVLRKGTKKSYHKKSSLISLPSIKKVPSEGSWTAHFQSLVDKAKKEKKKNAQAVKTLKKNMGKVKRNAYNLEVFASMGRFMKSDTELVLSIGKIARYADKARTAHKQNQSSKVVSYLHKMAEVADSAWRQYKVSYEHLKKVWQISRYPKGGKIVMGKRHIDFASRREDLSYLIMPEEALNLPGYAKNLRSEAKKYKEQGSL